MNDEHPLEAKKAKKKTHWLGFAPLISREIISALDVFQTVVNEIKTILREEFS